MNDLTGYCGLFCGACSFKVAFDEQDRRHLTHLPGKLREYADAPLQFCPGCRADESLCDECGIRECARAHSLEHCGLCAEFPCSRIKKFSEDGLVHHSEVIGNLELLKELGETEWLTRQKKRWTCECGAKGSWYLEACSRCRRVFGKNR